jgi:predicted metalloprotease with PDZ domain
MLMVDIEIIKNSNGKSSLHSVMKELYQEFALKSRGYSENDFQNICLKYGGEKVKKIFKNHIYGTNNYIPSLETALDLVGLQLKEKKNANLSAQYFGFVAIKENERLIIKKVEPDSEADQNEIAVEDEITEINGIKIKNNFSDTLKECKNKVTFKIKKKFSEKEITLTIGNYYKLLEMIKIEDSSKEQLKFRKIWTS